MATDNASQAVPNLYHFKDDNQGARLALTGVSTSGKCCKRLLLRLLIRRMPGFDPWRTLPAASVTLSTNRSTS